MSWWIPFDYQKVVLDVYKDIDVKVDVEIDADYDLDVDIYKDIDVNANLYSNVDLDGNLAVLTGNLDNISLNETTAVLSVDTDIFGAESFAQVNSGATLLQATATATSSETIKIGPFEAEIPLKTGTYTEIDIQVEEFDHGTNIAVIMESSTDTDFG